MFLGWRVFGWTHSFICIFCYFWNLAYCLWEFLEDLIGGFRLVVSMLIYHLNCEMLHTHLTELKLFLRTWSIEHDRVVILRNGKCPIGWLIALRANQLFHMDLMMARIALFWQNWGWLPLQALRELVPLQVLIDTWPVNPVQPPVSNLGVDTVFLRRNRQQSLTRRTVSLLLDTYGILESLGPFKWVLRFLDWLKAFCINLKLHLGLCL